MQGRNIFFIFEIYCISFFGTNLYIFGNIVYLLEGII
jgi:hypothetical protein